MMSATIDDDEDVRSNGAMQNGNGYVPLSFEGGGGGGGGA